MAHKFNWPQYRLGKEKARPTCITSNGLGGGDRIRTGVQTYSPKAFYMLIPVLFVGKQQEPDEPTASLAE